MSVSIGQCCSWLHIPITNQMVTESLGTSIQFQACLEWNIWCTRSGQYDSLWGDGFGIQICQVLWWRMKWVLARYLPQWLRLWSTSCWLGRLLEGCRFQFCGRIPLKIGWIWRRTTIPRSLVKNGSGICIWEWIRHRPAFLWCGQLHHCGVQLSVSQLNQCWWSQCPVWQRHSRVPSARGYMETISDWWTCCSRKMWISPRRISTAVSINQITHGISTMLYMIPLHPEQIHQATANSHTAHGVVGLLMSPISTRLKMLFTGKLRWKGELDFNFKSQPHWNSIQSMTDAIWRRGCFQVLLKILWMIQWWKRIVQRHCIALWRVWCMQSGQNMK